MLRVLRMAAAAMSAEQVRADLVAHNLANSETDGFRRLVVSAGAGGIQTVYRRGAGEVGGVASGPDTPRAVVDLRPGALVPTGNSRDLAVEGAGFVLLEGGRLTSSGRLAVDAEGYLTLRGVRVQGQAGPIRVGTGDFRVLPDGTVQVAGGRPAGRLRLVEVAKQAVSVVGSGLYAAPAQALREAQASVRTGYQQRAAVNAVEELVQLLAGLRAYEAAARCMQVADETAARLADVARV